MKKEEKAITLLSLVITIIVLLILTGITLKLTIGDRGILNIAKMASEKYTNSQEEEYAKLNEFSNEIGNKINIANTDATKVKPDNKYEIIYIGELSRITGDNGVVTSTFDIKEIYEDYQNLTIDNFVYRISHIYDHWNANYGIAGGNTLKYSYNTETGILIINNAYQKSDFNSGFDGSVYLIPNIETIKK